LSNQFNQSGFCSEQLCVPTSKSKIELVLHSKPSGQFILTIQGMVLLANFARAFLDNKNRTTIFH